jgi:hypothetical protein
LVRQNFQNLAAIDTLIGQNPKACSMLISIVEFEVSSANFFTTASLSSEPSFEGTGFGWVEFGAEEKKSV